MSFRICRGIRQYLLQSKRGVMRASRKIRDFSTEYNLLFQLIMNLIENILVYIYTNDLIFISFLNVFKCGRF